MQTENGEAVSDPRCKLKAACLSAAGDVLSECTSLLGRGGMPDTTTNGVDSSGTPLIQLLSRQARHLLAFFSEPGSQPGNSPDRARPAHVSLVLKRLGDILTAAYARFYAYVFKDLPLFWRQLYTDASILKFAALYLSWDESPGDHLDDMVKTLDLALILAGGAGERRGRRWIGEAFALLEDVYSSRLRLETSPISSRPVEKARLSQPSGEQATPWEDTPSFSSHEPFAPPVAHPVPRTGPLSISAFQRHLDNPAGPTPLVITNLTAGWPARTIHPWDKPAYLLSRTFGGRRLVPVEIGRSYVDAGWSQKVLPFGNFLSQYITHPTPTSGPPSSSPGARTAATEATEKAYLAQHPLLSQLPSLLADIITPDYVYTTPPGHPLDASLNQPELETPQLNAWFGPPGTITPLHTDPYHNLLVQVVGRKYVRLYAPDKSDTSEDGRMRPRGREGGVEMGNTSRVDVGVVEGWDPPLFPCSPSISPSGDGDGEEGKGWEEEFKAVPFVDCILEPGDTLYIPIGWWHYVRGLSVSFSVSFWWN